MRYLRKFNENSHDWASNAMPGASDEEIMRASFGDEDLHAKIQEHPGYHDARLAHPHASDEEIATMLGHYSVEPEKRPGYKPEEPEEECEPCGEESSEENTQDSSKQDFFISLFEPKFGGEEADHQEDNEENVEEERPTFGSRIKSYLGFGK